jgi:hypothetical protein
VRPAEIALPSGDVTVVDEADLPIVTGYRWRAYRRAGDRTVYVRAEIRHGRRTRTVPLHRFLLNAPPRLLVDHRDHDGLNNTRSNLRLCTFSQNAANMVLLNQNTSGYKGVTYHRQIGKWQAAIKVQGRNHYLGVYADPLQAAAAYDRAAVEAFGEFALINGVDWSAA